MLKNGTSLEVALANAKYRAFVTEVVTFLPTISPSLSVSCLALKPRMES